MAVENASKTLVTNTVSMTRKHITVNRALGYKKNTVSHKNPQLVPAL